MAFWDLSTIYLAIISYLGTVTCDKMKDGADEMIPSLSIPLTEDGMYSCLRYKNSPHEMK